MSAKRVGMSKPSPIVRFPGPGCIVEYMQGNQPQTAWTLEESGGKLRLFTLGQREMKLAVSRMLPWAGPIYSGHFDRADMSSKLAEHHNKRQQIAGEIDPLELWSLAQGEMQSARPEWFASLLWDDPDIDRLAGLGRTLLSCKSHFKFHPPEFEIYPADLVEKRLSEQSLAAERERLVGDGRDFLQELWNAWASGRKLDPGTLDGRLNPEVAAKLKALLREQIASPDGGENAVLWANLRKGLPEHPHQALLLAEQWGVVPPHHNYLLDQAGYAFCRSWEEAYAGDVERMAEAVKARAVEPETTAFVSIDSATTRDIDDAYHLERNPEGGYKLSLALACPVLGFDFSSPLARAVADRVSSLYLPEGVSHMLPEALGTDLLSLKAGVARPSLVIDMDIDADGELVSVAPRLAWVKLAANLNYLAVEDELSNGAAAAGLVLGHELAEKLRLARLRHGAVITERLEPKICLTGYPDDVDVSINDPDQPPMAQLLVSEMMILANAASAVWAAEHGVPLLFRTQNIELGPGSSGVWTKPEDIQAVVRQLAPPVMETSPRRHASLGVAAYAPITSPLRRYVDFINVEQVRSQLAEGAPHFSREELERMLPELAARMDAVGQIQRFRPRYWKLVYLKRHCRERTFTGVAVDEAPQWVGLALPEVQIFVRAHRDMLGEKVRPGQRFALRLGKIDPLTNEIRVLEAVSEE